MQHFVVPIKNDSDARLLAVFHAQGLIRRVAQRFVDGVRSATIDDADAMQPRGSEVEAVHKNPEELEVDCAIDPRETAGAEGRVSGVEEPG